MASKGAFLSLFFIANSLVLCVCSILYCLDYKHYTEECGQSEYVITCICVISAIIFGICGGFSIVFFLFHIVKKNKSCRIINFIMILSGGCLIFSIAAGTGMLISLYFTFDPNCLSDAQNKRDFVFLWLFTVYAVISNAITLVASIWSSVKEDQLLKNKTFPVEVAAVKKVPPV